MAKVSCDVCGEDAVQLFTLDRGEGPTVARCDLHAVPDADVGMSWVKEDIKKK